MTETTMKCPHCYAELPPQSISDKQTAFPCPICGENITHGLSKVQVEELAFYPVNEPFAYIKIIKNSETLERYYKVIEPFLSEEEQKTLAFIQEKVVKALNVSLSELSYEKIEHYLR